MFDFGIEIIRHIRLHICLVCFRDGTDKRMIKVAGKWFRFSWAIGWNTRQQRKLEQKHLEKLTEQWRTWEMRDKARRADLK
jgi:hypothetical protein